MQAVILAGGKGTRLKPYTTEIPKPLVSLGDRPIIEILLRRMQRHGVDRVNIAVNHLAHLIMAVLGDGRRLNLAIEYSLEEKPLSTVGPLKLMENLDDTFIVANGDILTDLDFSRLYEFHRTSRAKVTVAVHRRSNAIDYGVIRTSAEGFIAGFEEKPVYDLTVSMGVYVFSRSVLELVPKNTPFGFDNLMYKMLELNEPIATFPFDGYWMDIGRPDDYAQAGIDVHNNPALLE